MPSFRSAIFSLLTILAAGTHLLAQVAASRPAAATRPATKASTLPARSLDTPRDAVRWFAAALRDGDSDGLLKVVPAGNDAEKHMVAAMAEMAGALAKLNAAALATFGAEAAARFTNDTSADFDKTLARIEAAEVTIDGDAATVRYIDRDATEQSKPFKLKKTGAIWVIPASQFSGGAAPEVLDRQVAELMVQAKIVNDVSQEIAAGKYKNADAAVMAWRSKMIAAVSGGKGPGTEPANKP